MGDLRLWRVEFRRIRRGREELDTRYVYAKTAKMAGLRQLEVERCNRGHK
jgi:hypothetical protein